MMHARHRLVQVIHINNQPQYTIHIMPRHLATVRLQTLVLLHLLPQLQVENSANVSRGNSMIANSETVRKESVNNGNVRKESAK